MATLVRLYFADSSYITISEFENAVRERNGNFKGAFLKPGANVIVPGMDNPIHSEKLRPGSQRFRSEGGLPHWPDGGERQRRKHRPRVEEGGRQLGGL